MAEAERPQRRVAEAAPDTPAGLAARDTGDAARGRGSGRRGRCRANYGYAGRAGPRGAIEPAARAAASVEIEFDRRHDPHLLEGRVAGAIAFLGEAPSRGRSRNSPGSRSDAADGGARIAGEPPGAAPRVLGRQSDHLRLDVVEAGEDVPDARAFLDGDAAADQVELALVARRARATSVVRSWMRRLIVTRFSSRSLS